MLLMPGLAVLATWNWRGSADGAVRPELPLTSISALAIVIGLSGLAHVVGFLLSHIVWAAALEIGGLLQSQYTFAPTTEPYQVLIGLMAGDGPTPDAGDLVVVGGVVLLESIVMLRVVASKGLDIVMDGADLRSQGWIYQNIVRPKRNDYEILAYVLTTGANGEYGIGYQGSIAEIRTGHDGEIKTICLGEPEAFVYEIQTTIETASRGRRRTPDGPRIRLYERRWLGGVVAIEGAKVLNIVVHNIPTLTLDEFDQSLETIPESEV